jgi:hypothetical protein
MSHDGLALMRCRRCDQLWTTNANPAAITTRMFCPNCIPLVSHQISDRALGELIAYERPPRGYTCAPETERIAS